jgi:hypothetical protein
MTYEDASANELGGKSLALDRHREERDYYRTNILVLKSVILLSQIPCMGHKGTMGHPKRDSCFKLFISSFSVDLF